MNKLIEKPHLIFLFAIPIILFVGILNGNAVLDINVHDTYYVIAHLHLAILVSILFGIIGIGYWAMKKADKQLSKWLNGTHIGLTFGGTFLVWVLTKFYRTEIMEYEFNNYLSMVITIVILLIILGQLIFPINIIYGLIKRKDKINR
ncbi:cbb3-type cytochrome c oxidase subunit I [Muricauda sp. CAU 1633]|uniref:cbb3-type cytochrome c oxidase subunit I n=1 Tax=Allomuricauda sp. CAU 1633 TaxID=2816036 RepID=UPI001A8ED09D|nr:cbb3-type cytochrome c oxidase subunit I [Muricauda sp. CAU 1633]MBO0321436.1 cbb3-type cytochrome c oxidase subunit I [Muricauda sp. CAU 1633]